MPSRRAPRPANPKAREEHYWKKPTKHDVSDNESTKSSEASAASDDDGEEKIMVERYWKREPSAHKGCEAPSGEEKIIISRLWKKKSGGNAENGRDKEMPSANQIHGTVPYTSSSKSETSSSSSTSSESSSSSSSASSSECENSASEESSESDGEFIEHYWTRKTRVRPRSRHPEPKGKRSHGHRPESRGHRPPVCQKCGSYKYPRKH